MIRSNARLGACCLTQCKRVCCPPGRELTCLVSVMIRNWTLPLELTCHRFAATLEGLDLTMVGLIRKEYRSENASTWEPMPSWRGSYAAWGGGRGDRQQYQQLGGSRGAHLHPPSYYRHTIRSLQRRSCVGSQHTPSVPSDAMAENSGKFLRRSERRARLPVPTVGWGPLVGVEFGGGFGVGGIFPKIEFKDHKKDLYRTLEAAPIL